MSYQRTYNYKVLLDGREILDCITADDERGEVVVLKRDAEGRIVLNDTRDEVLTQVFSGRVEVLPLYPQ